MSPQAAGTHHGTRKPENGLQGATGAALTASRPVTRLIRRRQTPSHAWRYRATCSICAAMLGDGWTSEETATELAFEHARRHVEGEQLTLELELPTGRRRRRRRRAA